MIRVLRDIGYNFPTSKNWKEMSLKKRNVNGRYCTYKLKESTLELLKINRLLQNKGLVPNYDNNNVLKKTCWFKSLSNLLPRATPRTFKSFFFSKPILLDFYWKIFTPQSTISEIMYFENHINSYLPEDLAHAFLHVGKNKYRSSYSQIAMDLTSFDLVDFGIRWYDYDNYNTTLNRTTKGETFYPFNQKIFTISADGSASEVHKLMNFANSQEFRGNKYGCNTHHWHILGSFNRCYLASVEGMFKGKSTDPYVIDSNGLNEFLQKSNEYAIGDKAYSKFSNFYTLRDIPKLRHKARMFQVRKRSAIESLVGRFKKANILSTTYRHDLESHTKILKAISNIVFMDCIFYPLRSNPVNLPRENNR